MTEEKKPRVMSARGFLHKSSGKVSALAFLAGHREWLTTGSLSGLTSPILARLDSGELMPTPALHEIRDVVMNHSIAQEIAKGLARIDAEANGLPSGKGSSGNGKQKVIKNYSAVILNVHGQVQTWVNDEGDEKDLAADFEDGSSAERWIDRKLVDGSPDWHGEFTFKPNGIKIVVKRDGSFERIFRKKPGAVMHVTGKSSGGLTSKMRAKGDHFHFSKG